MGPSSDHSVTGSLSHAVHWRVTTAVRNLTAPSGVADLMDLASAYGPQAHTLICHTLLTTDVTSPSAAAQYLTRLVAEVTHVMTR